MQSLLNEQSAYFDKQAEKFRYVHETEKFEI